MAATNPTEPAGQGRLPAPTTVAVIADLHIGTSPRVDFFQHVEARFCRWLDQLEQRHDLIVLLGDVYQTQHGLRLGRATALRQLDLARRRLPLLSARFNQAPYLQLVGNHDQVAREALGAREQLILERDGFRVLLLHGHQLDPILQHARRPARLGTWFNGRIAALGLLPLAELLERKDVELKRGRVTVAYQQAARALLRRHQAQVVVIGHTHLADVTHLPEGLLVETGACSLGRWHGVTIDLVTRRVQPLPPP